jgi:hypothetical protein
MAYYGFRVTLLTYLIILRSLLLLLFFFFAGQSKRFYLFIYFNNTLSINIRLAAHSCFLSDSVVRPEGPLPGDIYQLAINLFIFEVSVLYPHLRFV